MARSPLVRPAISAQLAISAISAPNWQLFLAISTLNWHLLRKIQKNGGQSALQHRKGPRRRGGKPWEFGKTREAVGLKQHKKATAEEIPCKSVSCWKHFGAMLDKRWEVARARDFGRIFYARSPQQARCPMARDSLAMIRRLVWPSTSSLPEASSRRWARASPPLRWASF